MSGKTNALLNHVDERTREPLSWLGLVKVLKLPLPQRKFSELVTPTHIHIHYILNITLRHEDYLLLALTGLAPKRHPHTKKFYISSFNPVFVRALSDPQDSLPNASKNPPTCPESPEILNRKGPKTPSSPLKPHYQPFGKTRTYGTEYVSFTISAASAATKLPQNAFHQQRTSCTSAHPTSRTPRLSKSGQQRSTVLQSVQQKKRKAQMA